MLLYALTILVSAFLLFQVEPMIAKIILPWFGGSAGVWTICLLFFQVVLLLGYLYAWWLNRTFRPRAQALVHSLLLALSLAVLPILPSPAWKPTSPADPAFRILALLAATVGLPYFLLSTTGPLVQAWFARRYKDAVPYRLYALSNAGSMFALVSYPVLVEPVFTTRWQALAWSGLYAGFVVLSGAAAVSVSRAFEPPGRAAADRAADPCAATWLYWLALPACASLLLLAITNYLSQNVAAIPFLWVLPLSLYLLTFILCFDRAAWYRRALFLKLAAVSVGGMAYVMSGDTWENIPIKVTIPLFSAGLFFCCMVCHGELVRLKPDPRHLTGFYLMISAGGALGGIFVGLIAPHIFKGTWEMPLGLVVCPLLVVLALHRDGGTVFARQPVFAITLAAVLGLGGYLGYEIRQNTAGARLLARNFYGGLKVTDSGSGFDAIRTLTHGTINHGEQYLSPLRRDQPITYYAPDSGVGRAIRAKQPDGPLRVGVIGLGTGTIAAYGRRGDYYRFYEINPLVLDIARSQFTYLSDCPARLDVALGDARLSLEREAPENFDVLAVDAFSSDSIPIHLLTSEAFRLYFRHLKPDGVLAVHVSNRYLDLKPVVEREAAALGKQARLVDTDDDDDNAEVFGASWVLVTAHPELFSRPLLKTQAQTIAARRSLRLWTDDYSNLFQILK